MRHATRSLVPGVGLSEVDHVDKLQVEVVSATLSRPEQPSIEDAVPVAAQIRASPGRRP